MNADILGAEARPPDPQPRRVLVTGGATGIGAAIVDAFLHEGCEVVVLDRQPPAAADIRLQHRLVDLTDRAALTAIAAEVAAEAPLTTVVHNAGAIREKLLEEVTAEDIDALTALHITAAVLAGGSPVSGSTKKGNTTYPTVRCCDVPFSMVSIWSSATAVALFHRPVANRCRAWYRGEYASESSRAWWINSGASASPAAEMTRPTMRVMVTFGGRNRAASTQNTRPSPV